MKKILFLALGSRGDIEPFIAVAEILKRNGFDVACAAPAQYHNLVEESNITYFPLSEKFLDLLELEETKNHMGQKGSKLKRAYDLIKIYGKSSSIQKLLVKEQFEIVNSFNPDIVVHHTKCMYGVIWGIAHPGKSFMLSPVPGVLHKPDNFTPIIPKKNVKPWLVNITYKFVPLIYSKSVLKFTKDIQSYFPQIKFTSRLVQKFILEQEKSIYTVSQALFPKPKNWGKHVSVVGYFERNRTTNWQPSFELEKFLNINEKVLFITFGSMVNDKPKFHTQSIINLVSKYKIPTIINTSAGGFVKLDDVPGQIFFTETIPYEWIFPKVYAIIHHGGSGTTHTALKYGKPNMIIPHILDQFYWNNLNSYLKSGPTGIPIKKITEKTLEPLLLDLYKNERYKLSAENLAYKMKSEEDSILSEIFDYKK